MSASGPPLCRVCLKEHWMREPHILPQLTTGLRSSQIRSAWGQRQQGSGSKDAKEGSIPSDRATNTNADRGKAPKGWKRTSGRSGDSSSFRIPAQAGEKPATNTRREGRRVLKAEAARPDATRTAATAKPNPPTPPALSMAEEQTKADKVTPGKRKTAPKAKKRKGKKK